MTTLEMECHPRHIHMKKYAFGAHFGSTYICEELFSTMNHVKKTNKQKKTLLTQRRRQLVLPNNEGEVLQHCFADAVLRVEKQRSR